MSVFNGQMYLNECIESILSQTFENFEFLILDDASNDSTYDIIKNYKDKRIKLIRNEKNLGLTKSLNLLLDIVRGEHVARIDADDVACNERFIKQTFALDENKSVGMVASNCDIINENSDFLFNHCPSSNDTALKWSFIFRNPIRHSTVMLRKDVINKVGKYNEFFEFSQDYELWHRILINSKIKIIPETLCKIRNHKKSISSKMLENQYYFSNIVSKNQIEYYLKKYISNKELIKLKTIYVHRHPIEIKEINKIQIKDFDNILKIYFDLVLSFEKVCLDHDSLILEVTSDIKSLLKISKIRPDLRKSIKKFLKNNDILSKKIWRLINKNI
jgi:glycosyltransferase involved in cell wall biosynthesis